MKHHKYFNTIWTERDQEFWWDGVKYGSIVATFWTVCVIVDGIMFVRWIAKVKKGEA